MAQITLNSSGVASNGSLLLQSNGTTTAVTIDTAQNMGLGVTPSATWSSAARAIQLGGFNSIFGYTSNVFRLANNAIFTASNETYGASSIGATYYQQYNGAHSWYTAASGTAGNTISFTQAMTLDASGNLGVGTTSPSSRLEIIGLNPKLTINANDSSNGRTATLSLISGASGDVTSLCQIMYGASNSTTAGTLTFVEGDGTTERMRIDSSGNLLVGTTSAGGSKFRVNSSGLAGAFYVTAASTTATEAIQIVKFDNNSTTAQVFQKFYINDGAAACGQINANGANTAAFGSTSDSRLKENIVDLPSQLDNIMSLRPVEFDYIESEGGGHQIGFIAQEVQAIYPDLVGERADGMFTLTDLNKNDARLIKAIQEMKAIIDTQASTITQLQADVAALKGTA